MRQAWFVSRWLSKSILLRRCLSLFRLFRQWRGLFPVVRMGGLAVVQAFKGQGLGGALLADALTLRGPLAQSLGPVLWLWPRRMNPPPPSIGIMGLFLCRISRCAVLASGVRVACQRVSIWVDNFHAEHAFLMFRPIRCSFLSSPC